MSSTIRVAEGDAMPDVELDAYPGPGKGKPSDYRGRWLVLYFYPADDTPGCTKEACGFRDSMGEIRKSGAEVVGVSSQGVESHGRFSSKYGLNFTLFADTRGDLGRALGVTKEGPRVSMNRVTFLVGPDGRIRKIYPKVDVSQHSAQVLADLSVLKSA